MTDSSHHLIALPGAAFVARELAARFTPITGGNRVDEAQRLRYAGGWLWQYGDERLVLELRDAALAHGVPCRIVRIEEELAAAPTERVSTADLEDGHLFLELAHELVDIAAADIRALDLGIVGTPQGARTPPEEEMHRWSEGMLAGLTFPHLRAGLLGCGLGRPNPQAFLALPGRTRFLRIERGTRFPSLVGEAGPQALDSLLLFLDRLLAALPDGRVLPEVTRFWREGTIEPLVRHRIEERENRLSWLRAWLDSEADAAHRESEG